MSILSSKVDTPTRGSPEIDGPFVYTTSIDGTNITRPNQSPESDRFLAFESATETQIVFESYVGDADYDDFAFNITPPLEVAVDQCAADPVTCYAPQIKFDSDEEYFPMSADDFVTGSELMWSADTGCDDPVIAANPTPKQLTDGSYWGHERFNGFFICFSQDRFETNEFTRTFKDVAPNGELRARRDDGVTPLADNEGFYLAWNGDDAPTGDTPGSAPVYVEQVGNTIEYWFFYGFDPKSGAIDSVIAHEGDWEHIIVTLPQNGNPATAELFGHSCTSGQLDFGTDIEVVNGTHPVVYVANGSHAAYADEISKPNLGCGGDNPVEGTTDEADGDGPTWDTWTGNLVIANTQCWYGYGGGWGTNGLRWGPIAILDGAAAGPAGLPYQGNIPDVNAPAVDDCLDSDATVNTENPAPGEPANANAWDAIFDWLEPLLMQFENGTPGRTYIMTLRSLPQVIGTATVDANGDTEFDVSIPPGTPAGAHTIVIQDDQTGEEVFTSDLYVNPPANCTTTDPASDLDGDGIMNSCDPNPDDGPLADFDGDTVANGVDNCPTVANTDQTATSSWRSVGSACDGRLGINTVGTHQTQDYLAELVCGTATPNSETIYGTDGDDVINGTTGDDVILALGGNDTVNGLGGNDIICLGSGDDTVTTGNGDDYIEGRGGNDIIDAGDGINEIYAGTGNDQVTTGAGNDRVYTGDGDDTVASGDGDDYIETSIGADTISSTSGANEIYAGGGNDQVTTGAGNDRVYTGEGDDTVNSGDGNDYVETWTGIDTIDAAGGDNEIYAGDDDDIVTTGNGDNLVYAGGGADQITTGTGDDIVYGSTGNDQITTGDGDDYIEAWLGDDTIDAGDGINEIYAGGGADDVTTGTGNDRVYTGSGNDIVNSGPGDDYVETSTGDDTINAGEGANEIYAGGDDDTVTTGSSADLIFLGSGDDTATAGAGDDQITGGSGIDTADGGPGTDTCWGIENATNCE